MSIKSNKGTTLVELMVSIAIFGVIAAACMGLLMFATSINADITGDVVETSRVYQTLDLIKKTVAESSKVQTVLVERDVENSDVKDSIIGIVLSGGGTYEWSSLNKTLVFSVNSNSTVLLEDVESFEVLCPEENYLIIEFTMASGNKYELTVGCKNR